MNRLGLTGVSLAGVLSAFLIGHPIAAAADKEFVGSEACQKCHAKQYQTWKNSYHAKMVRKKDDGILKGVVEKWASDGTNAGPTKSNVDGKPRTLADVVYVVGSRWKQRFLVKNEATGGHQFLNQQYNRMSGKWEPYGNKNDWETNCATCHTTGFRLTSYDPAKPGEQKFSISEHNIGCEACHGPGVQHVKAPSKKNIYSFAGKSVDERTMVCGYCHIRAENDKFKTTQGNPSEHMPAPRVGDSYRAGEDWRKWYPSEIVIPGVHAEDKIDVAYAGDLKGLVILDDISKAGSFYDSAKHHQQYQEFLQSAHFKKNIMSCNDCHSAHAAKDGKVISAKDTCANCHDATFTVEKYMPGTGVTVQGLLLRTHTFNKNQTRTTKGAVASGEPEYQNKK
ncbi:MAG TPA: multiheme c-type cytochrome [Burkholderiales bacterium]|nr:multiheme c-type cytochrome [Burkholderiales bacterium]